jgi:hypothetical protein
VGVVLVVELVGEEAVAHEDGDLEGPVLALAAVGSGRVR